MIDVLENGLKYFARKVTIVRRSQDQLFCRLGHHHQGFAAELVIYLPSVHENDDVQAPRRGMHIRLHLMQAPEEAKSIPFDRKRKRGRLSKGKRSLLIQ